MTRKASYYWDASISIAWITGEKRSPEDLAGLIAAAGDIDAGRRVLVTSALTLCEVLAGTLDEQETGRFSRLFERSNIVMYEVTFQIAKGAGAIRDACRRRKLKCPPTVDAVHIATAALVNATEVHSFDPHFLALNGTLPDCSVPICKPRSLQGVLDV